MMPLSTRTRTPSGIDLFNDPDALRQGQTGAGRHTAPVVIGIVGPGLRRQRHQAERIFRRRDGSARAARPAAFQADRQLYNRLFEIPCRGATTEA
jgi:hypothetical protein